jgi:hypothetical protein
MTPDFVRYSLNVECADADFERTCRRSSRRHEARYGKIGRGRGRRAGGREARAKGYRLARGEVEILEGLPHAYAQPSLFRKGE